MKPKRWHFALLGACGLVVVVMCLWSVMPRLASHPQPIVWTGPKSTQPLEPADIAAARRLKDGTIDPHFDQMHRQFIERGKGAQIGILFLGDSITQGWTTTGLQVWNKRFAADHPANFGISGDRTQNLIWRIENGELDHISPRVVVLMIGTNNTDYPWEQIARADEKIVREIRKKLPQSKLLLLGIFPREFSPLDPVREKIRSVNRQLATSDDGRSTRYLDIGDRFLKSDGTMSIDLMPDFLHPSANGYQAWADAMRPILQEMLK